MNIIQYSQAARFGTPRQLKSSESALVFWAQHQDLKVEASPDRRGCGVLIFMGLRLYKTYCVTY